MVAAAEEALAECVAATNGADVLAISLSTAMHGLLGLDAAAAAADAADHLGRRARPRAGAVPAPVRPGRGAARAHRRARASDVAADQAHVVRAPRPADAGGRALVGRPEGLPDRGADRHAGHRAVVGVGHRPARSRDARLEPGGDRAGRGLRRAASGDPADDRDACRWRRRVAAPARPAAPARRS